MRLTVSPAPLVTSGENRNVLVAMTYGESVPRAAVEMACTECDGVDSFPSCAIVTGNFHARRHDEDDLRAIDGMGVSDAMRCCVERYTTATAAPIGQAVAQLAPCTDAPLAASPTLAAPVPGGVVGDEALNGRVSRRALARRRARKASAPRGTPDACAAAPSCFTQRRA
ncbi:GSCFA domain-containing protein [Burkholderia pseudomallei]|uniref:GSCFA domain-containing protein n=2 Tax=Burkholderia pseudomallei TaxID=28450 RepID=UPI0005D835D3|nr:GSCFA domain-containing protein [Burkholderia pseudomallei]AJX71079.1 GSCFA family protein [Burkholderia pseudomallei MSHR840]